MARFGASTPVSDSVSRALKEYMWWSAVRSVQTHFEGRFADGSRVPSYAASFERTITKSEARGSLHDVMEAEAHARARERAGTDDAVPTLQDYARAMRSTIAERVSFLDVDGETVVPYDLTFMGQRADEATRRFALHHMGSAGEVISRFSASLDHGVLLMSPFDSTLSAFEATAVAGVDVVGVDVRGRSADDLSRGPFTEDGTGGVACDFDWFGHDGSRALFRRLEPLSTPFADESRFFARRGRAGITSERGFFVSASGQVEAVSSDEAIVWGSPVDAVGLASLLPSLPKDVSLDGISERLFRWAAEQASQMDVSPSEVLRSAYGQCREQVEGAAELAQECLSRGWSVSMAPLGQYSVSVDVDLDEDALGDSVRVNAIDMAKPGQVGDVFFDGSRYSRFFAPDGRRASRSQPVQDGEVALVTSDGARVRDASGRPVSFAGGRRSLETMACLEHLLGEPQVLLEEDGAGRGVRALANIDGRPVHRGASASIADCRLVRTQRGYEVRPPAFYHSKGASFTLVDSASSRPIAADGSFEAGGVWPEGSGTTRIGQHPVRSSDVPFMSAAVMAQGARMSSANPEWVLEDLWESAMENYARTMADVGDGGAWEPGAVSADTSAEDVLAPLFSLADHVMATSADASEVASALEALELPVSDLENVQRAYLRILTGEADSLELPHGRFVVAGGDGRVDPSSFDGVLVTSASGAEVFRGDAEFVDVAPSETEWVSAQAMAQDRGISIEEARRAVCEMHFEAARSVALGRFHRGPDGRIEAVDMALAQGEWQGGPFGEGTYMRPKSLNVAGVSEWAQARGSNGQMTTRATVARALSLILAAKRLSTTDLFGISSDDGKATDDAVGRLVDEARTFEEEGAKTLPRLIFEARLGAAEHFLSGRRESEATLISRSDQRLMADLAGTYASLGLDWPDDATDVEDVWRASPKDFARAVGELPAVARLTSEVQRTPAFVRSRYAAMASTSASMDEVEQVDDALESTLVNELDRLGVDRVGLDTTADLWMALDGAVEGLPSYDEMWEAARADALIARARREAASAGLQDPVESDPTVTFWTQIRDTLADTLSSQGVVVDVDADVLVDETGNLRWSGWVFTHASVGNAAHPTPEAAVEAARRVLAEASRSDGSRDKELAIRHLRGFVGPLFAPDHDGIVRSANLASSDWSAVVGWRASMDMSSAASSDSFSERLFLESYSQRVARAMAVAVVGDCSGAGQGVAGPFKEVGSCSSLGGAFRRMTSGHRHDGVEWGSRERDGFAVVDSPKVLMATDEAGEPLLSYDERVRSRRSAMEVMEGRLEATSARAEASRVTFPTVFREEASPVRSVQRSLGMEPSGDDTRFDLWEVLGERSVWVKTDKAFEGIFDHAGPMTSLAQGSVGFLVQGASVDADGYVTAAPADGPRDARRSYLLSDEAGVLVHSRSNPADRQNMPFRSVLDARGITGPVGVACASLGGYTMDGGIVVSSEMADSCLVEDASDPGHLRPLRPGDKLSDMHGNKGVVSLVVPPKPAPGEPTPTLSPSARRVAELFWANDGRLSFAMEPYFWSGRLAPGGYEEAMANLEVAEGVDLTLNRPGNDHGPLDWGISLHPIIVASQTADSKTKRYENAPGVGRRASAQLAQVLAAKGASAVGRDLFGKNNDFMDVLDERLRILGWRADADGRLGRLVDDDLPKDEATSLAARRLLGKEPLMRERRIMWASAADAQDADGFGALSKGTWTVGRASTSRGGLAAEICRVGGLLAMPFPIRLASGDETPLIRRSGDDHESWEAELPSVEAGEWGPWGLESGVWGLPVEPLSMRFAANGLDGVIPHDDTRLYLRLAELACAWQATWRDDVTAISHIGGGFGEDSQRMALVTQGDRERARKVIREAAQRAYDQAVPRLEKLAALSVRKSGVSVPQGKSAHVVIYPDPDLSMAEVAMPEGMRRHLGVEVGDEVFDFRDPAIQAGNVALSGVVDARGGDLAATDAIGKQPAWDKQADADFDGDMEGVFRLSSDEGLAEAARLITPAARILDFVQPPDARGLKGAFANMGLDVASGMALNPALAERYGEWKVKAAEHFSGREPWVRAEVTLAEAEGDRALLAELDEIVRDSYDVEGAFAEDALAYSPDAWTYLRSLYVTGVEHAGKGSLSKLADFARRGGFGEDGGGLSDAELACVASGEHADVSWSAGAEAAPSDLAASEFATATKSAFTGRAGKFLQLLVADASWHSPEASWCVSSMTALVTQALLQAKHDADQALTLASAVTDAMNHLWCGHRFRVVTDESGFFDRVECAKVSDASLSRHVFSEPGGAFAHATVDEWVDQAVELYGSLGTPLDPAIARAIVSFDVDESLLQGSKAPRGLLWTQLAQGRWKGRDGAKGLSDVTWTDPVSGEARSYADGSRYMVGVKTDAICDGMVPVFGSHVAKLGFEKRSFDSLEQAADAGICLYGDESSKDNYADIVCPDSVRRARVAFERRSAMEFAADELDLAAEGVSAAEAERMHAEAEATRLSVEAETQVRRAEAMRPSGRGVATRQVCRDILDAPSLEDECDWPMAVGE